MAEDYQPDRSRKREQSPLTNSFTALPSDIKPVIRSYSEIRKQMHQSLQARLKGEYNSVLKSGPSQGRQRTPQWATFKKSVLVTALANIRIEAKLKTLAARMKAEAAPKPQTALPFVRHESADLSKLRQRSVPTYPMVSLKEAMRDKEWLIRAKDAIQRNFSTLINESNGLQINLSSTFEPFKYFVKKGNNSKLVNQIMKTRPWWVRVKVKSEAHFVWSPKREMDWIAGLPCAAGRAGSKVDRSKAVVSCGVKYVPQESKVGRVVNVRSLGFGAITSSTSFARVINLTSFNPNETHIHNRLEHNYHLTHKKALYRNMKQYYMALGEDYTQQMPLTFHIIHGESDVEFHSFVQHYNDFEAEMQAIDSDISSFRNLWIVKPGENSNQGRDIVVCSTIDEVRAELRSPVDRKTGLRRTYIIQKYIERPFLYNKRKFDIRCYALITGINGVIQGYFYPEGYLRTSAREFTLKSTWDKYVHLTNDAVQKTSEDYGKFEHGNKVSFADFQKYLEARDHSVRLIDHILPAIRKLVQDSIKATYFKLDPSRRHATFEILGYDIMLDYRLKPVLIEVNTNPCLALVAPLLFRVIPQMVDGALRIVLDSLFPELQIARKAVDSLPENRWELIFHELVDGKALHRALQSRGSLPLLQASDSFFYDSSSSDNTEGPGH